MAGKIGYSGRQSKVVTNYANNVIDKIKLNVHDALSEYISHVVKKARRDVTSLTDKEKQHLITLHIKHAPDPQTEQGKSAAEQLIERMCVAGAQEYARIKAASGTDTKTVHARVMRDVVTDELDNG